VTSTPRIRLGYVGAGALAQSAHLPNLQSLSDECDLVALAELRPRLGRTVADHFRIPTLYPSHRELADDPNVDAAIVSGHFSAQGDIAADLLLAGKDVFVEKPMALTIDQANHILDAERRSGHRLMVGYVKRFDPGNRLARELVRELRETHILGRPTFVRAHMFAGDWKSPSRHPVRTTSEPLQPSETHFPEWLPDTLRSAYVGYLHAWTHHINLVRFLLDSSAAVKVVTTDLTASADGEDVLGIVSSRVDGIHTVIESGVYSKSEFDEHFQVYFESGWVKATAPPVLLLDGMTSTVELHDGDKRTTSVHHAGFDWSYREELRHFLHALRTSTEFDSTASDAAVDVRFFEDVFRHVADYPRG
jgi:predicted dehydrogenase